MKVVLKLDNMKIPYFSQIKEVEDKDWAWRACGITCVKMVLEWADLAKDVSVTNLIDEGILINGYTPDGWIHDALVNLLRNHGLSAYRQEFRSVDVDINKQIFITSSFEESLVDAGLSKMILSVHEGVPVIVSVSDEMCTTKFSHIVVLIGYDGKTNEFIYHNPDEKEGQISENARVSFDDFKKYWRKFSIFIER